MIFTLFAKSVGAHAVAARIREIVAALDEDTIDHDAEPPLGEGPVPRLMRTTVTACGRASDWSDVTVAFASLDSGIGDEPWSLIGVPRTVRSFGMADVSVMDPNHPAAT